MGKEEYLCGDVLVDILNYFVQKDHLDVFKNTTLLMDICKNVRKGKRYSLNGYRLDFGVLAQALLEHSLMMHEITKSSVSDLSKTEIDFTNMKDCNELAKQFYDQDEIEKFAQYLMTNDAFFHTLVEQFIEYKIVEPARKKEEATVLKQVAKKSNYVKQLEKEEERYAYLRTAVVETSKRHGNQATREGFLYYVDTLDAKGLSNSTCRAKLNSYSRLELQTILLDYIVREYSELEKNNTYEKQELIDCIKTSPELMYQYKIPEAWYIEYVNDMINGFYEDVDKENSCYQELMQQVFSVYQKEKKKKNKR